VIFGELDSDLLIPNRSIAGITPNQENMPKKPVARDLKDSAANPYKLKEISFGKRYSSVSVKALTTGTSRYIF
jgi:hypothetical protein